MLCRPALPLLHHLTHKISKGKKVLKDAEVKIAALETEDGLKTRKISKRAARKSRCQGQPAKSDGKASQVTAGKPAGSK